MATNVFPLTENALQQLSTTEFNEILEYKILPTANKRRKTSKSSQTLFEEIDQNLYKAEARMVAFYTRPERLHGWIMALAHRYYAPAEYDDTFACAWEDPKESVSQNPSGWKPKSPRAKRSPNSTRKPGRNKLKNDQKRNAIVIQVSSIDKKPTDPLVSITIYLSTGTIQCQGNHIREWSQTEFPALLQLANFYCKKIGNRPADKSKIKNPEMGQKSPSTTKSDLQAIRPTQTATVIIPEIIITDYDDDSESFQCTPMRINFDDSKLSYEIESNDNRDNEPPNKTKTQPNKTQHESEEPPVPSVEIEFERTIVSENKLEYSLDIIDKCTVPQTESLQNCTNNSEIIKDVEPVSTTHDPLNAMPNQMESKPETSSSTTTSMEKNKTTAAKRKLPQTASPEELIENNELARALRMHTDMINRVVNTVGNMEARFCEEIFLVKKECEETKIDSMRKEINNLKEKLRFSESIIKTKNNELEIYKSVKLSSPCGQCEDRHKYERKKENEISNLQTQLQKSTTKSPNSEELRQISMRLVQNNSSMNCIESKVDLITENFENMRDVIVSSCDETIEQTQKMMASNKFYPLLHQGQETPVPSKILSNIKSNMRTPDDKSKTTFRKSTSSNSKTDIPTINTPSTSTGTSTSSTSTETKSNQRSSPSQKATKETIDSPIGRSRHNNYMTEKVDRSYRDNSPEIDALVLVTSNASELHAYELFRGQRTQIVTLADGYNNIVGAMKFLQLTDLKPKVILLHIAGNTLINLGEKTAIKQMNELVAAIRNKTSFANTRIVISEVFATEIGSKAVDAEFMRQINSFNHEVRKHMKDDSLIVKHPQLMSIRHPYFTGKSPNIHLTNIGTRCLAANMKRTMYPLLGLGKYVPREYMPYRRNNTRYLGNHERVFNNSLIADSKHSPRQYGKYSERKLHTQHDENRSSYYWSSSNRPRSQY